MQPAPYHPRSFTCSFPGCGKSCHTRGGLKRHGRIHRGRVARIPAPQHQLDPPHEDQIPCGRPDDDNEHIRDFAGPDDEPWRRQVRYHPIINGTPCDRQGNGLAPNVAPLPRDHPPPHDWAPFETRPDFEFADFLYRKAQLSAGKIDELTAILAAMYGEQDPLFRSHRELYQKIDSIGHGDAPWHSFSVKYAGPLPDNPPAWMTADNTDFAGSINYAPKVLTDEAGEREVGDLMSGQWAWDQCETIAQDPDTHGAMFAPIVLGSDKTTVSVGTGDTAFYPLYVSLGNVHNNIRRAHRNAVGLLAFLAIPKSK
ncbi:hypothetical protein JVT61DRAFT_15537 [Boletus reticuloceps]|uniref:C2H2-type domain-containing protein n=1 Tax=Boletus reticuloceps TaxID=495285 RepID=A0A8I2YCA0_9AGAM|nr:hypothetical protein JVT61DRAFT_15537 [Boletus reticuloceps]